MPRNLTIKEVEYIDELIKMNRSSGNAFKKTQLEKPMSNNERQIRFRIRQKVRTMVRDLTKIRYAGFEEVDEVLKAYDDSVAIYLDDKYQSEEDRAYKDRILYG